MVAPVNILVHFLSSFLVRLLWLLMVYLYTNPDAFDLRLLPRLL